MHAPSFLSLFSFEIPPRPSSIRPEIDKNHVDLRCSGSSVSSDVGVIPKRRGGRLLFPLPSFNEHPLMTHFRVSEGSYLAPSSPLLPAQPLVRSRPDLHGPVRHACDLFPIPFFVGNPRSFSFNSPRNRKKSRGSQVLGIVSFLLTSASFRNGIVAGFYFHSHRSINIR